MESRMLGGSGLKVPVLCLGTGTFGGGTEFFKGFGASDVAEATRLVDVCLEAGLNLFDSADIYSEGLAEEILGKALEGRRHTALISTKGTFRLGTGPNDVGSSRHHLFAAVEGSLRRLGTDSSISTAPCLRCPDPLSKGARRADDLCARARSGTSAAPTSGWHLMKSLAMRGRAGPAALRRAPGVLLALGPQYEWVDAPGHRPEHRTVVWSPLRMGASPARSAGASPARDEPAAHAGDAGRGAGF
jgi:hypothetical protein